MINLLFISLLPFAGWFLYYQLKIYKEQKQLIKKEMTSLRILKKNNIKTLGYKLKLGKSKVEA
ncbi:hypothetical protein BH23BAC2_BH23BAC2_17010 [soil metagenome]